MALSHAHRTVIDSTYNHRSNILTWIDCHRRNLELSSLYAIDLTYRWICSMEKIVELTGGIFCFQREWRRMRFCRCISVKTSVSKMSESTGYIRWFWNPAQRMVFQLSMFAMEFLSLAPSLLTVSFHLKLDFLLNVNLDYLFFSYSSSYHSDLPFSCGNISFLLGYDRSSKNFFMMKIY